MSAASFTRRWIVLLALLAGLIALAPYIALGIGHAPGCGGMGDACEAASLGFAQYGRTLLLAVLALLLVTSLASRAFAVGVFAWAFPFGLLMLAGSAPLLLAVPDFRSPDFLHEIGALPAVTPFLFFVVLCIALSACPEDGETGPAAVGWRALLGASAIATALVTAPAWLVGVATLPLIGMVAQPLALDVAALHAALHIDQALARITLGCLVAFLVASGGLILSGSAGRSSRRMRHA